MDGTFKSVPQWYQQLFTIYVFVAGNLVPGVCCLCTGEVIGTYGLILQALINKAAVLMILKRPDTTICGYFPNTILQGCYFYFCQAVHRKVGKLGLKIQYRTEEKTKKR
ncbi:hypothetical protein T11_15914 [Trichinella zimbabwensis]|uniref:Uncharacterized protein n=1 Tax=Trichinella zimbabwensis TaxID=268475 RepID=A0A0V1HLX8_9BILA|nr:hypothetical protein T11_15914 [Trichinella zimbabwensis]